MTLKVVRNYLEDLFKSYWGEQPCKWQNKAYKEPTDKNAMRADFGFYTFGESASIVGGLGKSSSTTTGRVIIDIYVPLGRGTDLCDETLQALKDLFRKRDIRPCNLFFRNVRVLYGDAKGAFYQGTIELDFEFSEVR